MYYPNLRTRIVTAAVLGLNLITGVAPAHAATGLTTEEKGFALGAASGAICYVQKGESSEVIGARLDSVISDEQYTFLETDKGKDALKVLLQFVNDDCSSFDIEALAGSVLAPYIF
jgi:hypothetical protein